MDTNNKKSFTVYLPDKTIKFPQLRGGLYARSPQESKPSFQLTSILKNEKQENFVTKVKTQKAEAARKLQKAMGFPSQDDLKKAINLNLIKNSNVPCADIDLATEMFGIDIPTKKGKIVRKKSSKTIQDKIEILTDLIKQNKWVGLGVGTITVNIFYQTAQYVPNKNRKTIKIV